MKRDYVIKRLIKAGSVQEALRNENKARLIEVYELDRPDRSSSAIGFNFPINENPDPYWDKDK